jgi:hypothetical protein
VITKHKARLHGRIYCEGRGNYSTQISSRAGSVDGWVTELRVTADEMDVVLALELLELDEFISEMQKVRIKLAEDVAAHRASRRAKSAKTDA